jgi:hypothetical protein
MEFNLRTSVWGRRCPSDRRSRRSGRCDGECRRACRHPTSPPPCCHTPSHRTEHRRSWEECWAKFHWDRGRQGREEMRYLWAGGKPEYPSSGETRVLGKPEFWGNPSSGETRVLGKPEFWGNPSSAGPGTTRRWPIPSPRPCPCPCLCPLYPLCPVLSMAFAPRSHRLKLALDLILDYFGDITRVSTTPCPCLQPLSISNHPLTLCRTWLR